MLSLSHSLHRQLSLPRFVAKGLPNVAICLLVIIAMSDALHFCYYGSPSLFETVMDGQIAKALRRWIVEVKRLRPESDHATRRTKPKQAALFR